MVTTVVTVVVVGVVVTVSVGVAVGIGNHHQCCCVNSCSGALVVVLPQGRGSCHQQRVQLTETAQTTPVPVPAGYQVYLL